MHLLIREKKKNINNIKQNLTIKEGLIKQMNDFQRMVKRDKIAKH